MRFEINLVVCSMICERILGIVTGSIFESMRAEHSRDIWVQIYATGIAADPQRVLLGVQVASDKVSALVL